MVQNAQVTTTIVSTCQLTDAISLSPYAILYRQLRTWLCAINQLYTLLHQLTVITQSTNTKLRKKTLTHLPFTLLHPLLGSRRGRQKLSRVAARDNVRVLFLIRFLGSDLFLYFLNLNFKSLTSLTTNYKTEQWSKTIDTYNLVSKSQH